MNSNCRQDYPHDLARTRTGVANNPTVGRVLLRDRIIVWCDAAFADMFAYPAGELIGESTNLLYRSARVPATSGESGWPLVARGEIFRTALELNRKDGSAGWYDISLSWLSHDSDEQCGAFIDVSAQRGTWLSLLEAEEHYRGIFAAMAEGVIVHARDGRVIDANAAAERILMLGRDQILGKNSGDPQWGAVHEDGTPFPGEEHPASITLRTGQPIRNQLMGVRSRNGELCWISVMPSRSLVKIHQCRAPPSPHSST
jgi:PAS domain S-box-containing protein